MKKLILLLIIIPVIGVSQQEFYKWDIGINGGLNINNPIIEGNNFSPDDLGGQLYGLTVIYHFNRFFAFKVDLDIENRGWAMKEFGDLDGDGITNDPKIKNISQVLNYFDIPAFMHIGFGKKFKVDLNIGPYFGFKIKDEIVSYSPNEEQLDSEATRGVIGLSKFDNFDFGVVYGIGFDYQIHERFSIGFDALYERGLKTVNKINNVDYKNSSFDFDFGINFHLGKKKK
ncbi:porin family protein [Flavobacteriales bacterium]|nr:porin family protein [Flavobacteriales bacterium]